MTMNEKSLQMLEFPRIRQIIAGYTSFGVSRELAESLQPLHNYTEITRLLGQCGEARRLLAVEPDFSIGDVQDIRDYVRKAALQSVLEPQELVEIQRTLTSLRQLKSAVSARKSEFSLLWELAGDITELRQVEKEISACIAPTGEVLDTASPELAGIRKQARDVRNQLLARLEAMVQ